MRTTALGLCALVSLASPPTASSQDDVPIVRAIVVELHAMQSREGFPDRFVFREGFFRLSRDDIRRTLKEPTREWTEAERQAVVAVAEEVNVAVRFCRSDCERTETEWLVDLGVPEHTSQQIVVVPVQVAASNDPNSSWHTAYAFTLARRPRDTWSVIDVWPGMSSHAERCVETADREC
jgi:hypothetical protein